MVGVYDDSSTGRPAWIAVGMGAFSLRTAVVPFAGALVWGTDVVVAHDRETVLEAPPVDFVVSLVPDDEARLVEHYATRPTVPRHPAHRQKAAHDMTALIAVEWSTGIEDAWSDVASFVPKFIGFLIILLIGYFVAKLIAKAVGAIFERVGFDKAVERGGIKKALDRSEYDASDILAKVVFYALFLIVLQMAFGVFGQNPISDLLEGVIAYLPKVIAAILIIVIASAIAAAARELIDASLGGLSYGTALANATGIAIVVVGDLRRPEPAADRPGHRHRPVLRRAGDHRRLGRHRHRRWRHRPDAVALGQRPGPLRRREAEAAARRAGLQGPHRPARPATRRPGPQRRVGRARPPAAAAPAPPTRCCRRPPTAPVADRHTTRRSAHVPVHHRRP